MIGLLAAGLVGILTAVFLLLGGFQQAIAVPLVRAYYRVRFYLSLLPQYLIWSIPVVGMGALLLASYLRAARSFFPREEGPTEGHADAPDPLWTLATTIAHARRSPFYRKIVVQTLGKIAVRIIAEREGISLPEARERFAGGDWCEDRAVQNFLLSARADGRKTGNDFARRLDEAVSRLEKLEQGV